MTAPAPKDAAPIRRTLGRMRAALAHAVDRAHGTPPLAWVYR